MTFDAWEAHWGVEHESNALVDYAEWNRLPAADRPLYTEGPADYTLLSSSRSSINPAVGAAADGRDAGAQIDRLPEVPPVSPDR